MNTATSKQIKTELSHRSKADLEKLIIRLARFKKENKELLSYLIFEAENEALFISDIKEEIDEQFDSLNRKSYYLMKKGIQKILRNIKKHIRYSPVKETEVELLIYFCKKMKRNKPSMNNNTVIRNMYARQLELATKKIKTLNEDLQYDYNEEIEKIKTL